MNESENITVDSSAHNPMNRYGEIKPLLLDEWPNALIPLFHRLHLLDEWYKDIKI